MAESLDRLLLGDPQSFLPGAGQRGICMDEVKPDWLLQMEGILEALNEGVLIVDDCNRIVFVNECMVQMCGYPVEEAVGRTPGHFYTGDDLAFLNQQIARGEKEGRLRYEFYVPRRNGERVPVVISSRVIEDPEGRPFAVVTFTDITEQKKTERQLKEANERLEKRQKEIETELALASRVQQSLAPQGLRWGRVAVETYYQPVRTIGGDFGLATPAGDSQLNLLVCDVSGHGIGSALVANRIYSETMSLLERRVELDDLLRRLNRFVLQQIRMTGFFFTMAIARLTDSGRRMSFVSAGHPPSIWISRRGEMRLLETQSSVLGCFENAVAPEPAMQVELEPGDRVTLYTDGLTEVFDRRDEMLGVGGLQEIVQSAAKKTLPEMKQAILEGVEAWRHGPLTDDISLVLVEFR
jgi:sigma-B regulation protein RsbU (phosphoserine phosphatase)